MTTITIFENCRIFDGEDADRYDRGSVVVEDARIREVVEGRVTLDAGTRLDCGGRWLMPGLIDAHFHACMASFNIAALDRMPPSLRAPHAARILEASLRRGFTTVRDAGGADVGLWLALQQGLIDGPRLFYSGRVISQTGGHGDLRAADHVQPCACVHAGALSVIADGVDEIRKAVREELRQGAHQIKLFVSGGVLSPADPIWMPQFSHDEIRTAVAEAATRRTYVMAHCHTDESALRSIECGVRTIEHATEVAPTTAAAIARAGAFVVPTLSILDVLREHGPALALPPASVEKISGLYEKSLASIETCLKAGVSVGLGSDLVDLRFLPLQGRELALRGELQSPLDVLRAATSVNARILQAPDTLGCIRPGACADLLVLNGDPTADLALFTQPEMSIPVVMRNGQFIRNGL